MIELDKAIGIEVYSTDFKGIGGRTKFNYSSFIVEEVIKDIRFVDDGYALYRLEKEGIDTQHVIDDIARKHNLRLKIFGLKDANAKTSQYAISTRKHGYKEIRSKHYSLKFLGYTNHITRSHILGNRFTITIKDCNANNIDEFERYVREKRIANFYGYQRFGLNPMTHLVGREIIKRNFKGAVELLIENSKGFDAVRLEYEKSRNPISALRRVPIRIRRLFVEAYKSYIFNRTLSAIIEQDDLKTREGDILFKNGELGIFDDGILAIPTAGYAFKTKRFADIIDAIMREEGVNHKDFYIKEMEEVSSQSNFRQAVLDCNEFAYKLEPLTLKFMLQRGGYATILLREVMKPDDPLAAGLA